ncbi:SAC3 family protein A isoform X1 [Prosopis cineraria]|uniref:SAC3 family protein A isoform X1 n=3 Tax=Prosopis cineraria TaxID=364024 RepID=UPI00240F92CB|nr:SAC3 family protein A isoform X1 [Prosopis cineraria]XP_054787828.1 SAC3 family protein A isoform X1 [Prosopis cineraria]
MTNEGSNTETLAPVEPHLFENRHIEANQQQSSSYAHSTTGPEAVSWTVHENGVYSNAPYQYDQQTQPPPGRSMQDGQNASSVAGNSSNLGTANVPQDYNAYTSYPSSSNPYGYGSMGYASYYSNYQQQPNHTYSQPVGAYQNAGAPYQPLSSFQNTGSYAGSASYPSTYYNPGDYQTPGGYQNSSYGNQTTMWNNGNYSSYSSHPYTNYAPDSTGAYSSGTATTSLQYQQQYKQWADYYSQTEVSCAPGTENLSVTSSSTLGCPIPEASSGYVTPNSQPVLSYAQYWRPESNSSTMASSQPGAVTYGAHDGYWKHGAQSSQIHHNNTIQPNYQTPLDLKSSYDKFQDPQKTASSQGTDLQFPSPQQVSSTPIQAAPSMDTRRVSKLQIPTNPRIASNLTLGLPKAEKDSSMNSAAPKPAYISVSLPKPMEKVTSNDAVNSILKPGMFPKSLRGYVERALARCKDDKQMAASQAVMKEIITKATADSTLYTKNWEIEPLFPIPDADAVDKDSSECSTNDSLVPKYKRSPSRRSKSRWEPLPEEKPAVTLMPNSNHTEKYSSWAHVEKDRKVVVENKEGKEDGLRNNKWASIFQRTSIKTPQRVFKKQRLAEAPIPSENGDASSDSDKEQGLTAYYSGAMALADSPEERKRRENRSKRFELGQGHRSENSRLRPKNAGAGNLYNRRASALVLSKSFEDGSNKAVEDIDWDALTVKGTCQEIEKRYLRLTSAPDPATVRPEEVLEKALLMVQNSHKNYLYKCDQLKSIRQDLTVQRIHNQLTVKVYETHARLALEVGDLPEYNQCQSQLKALYAEGIEGSHMEFAAYNLLCVILHSNNNRDLVSSMSRLSVEAKEDEAVKHALAVRAAVTSGNYVAFFRLYKAAPNLNTCLMDLCVEKMRYKAVTCMCRSYRPTVPVSYVAQVLGFSTSMATDVESNEKDADAFEECVEWLKVHGAIVISDSSGETLLDTKASSSTLYMPEPEDAVSHGDANLAVNDFLARAPL